MAELTKLKFTPRPPSNLQPFDVLFNPTSYSVTKSVVWTQQAATSATTGTVSGTGTVTPATNRELDAPPLVFGGGGARLLNLQLFCDVTEGPQTDVREVTRQLVALTRIESGLKPAQPPVVEISWGKEGPDGLDFPFVGVVTNLQQNFVLFSRSGEPLRANVTLAVTEFIDPEQNQRHTDPDLTTYTVKRGDTLSAIAAVMYRDAGLWRLIAQANGLDDPRRLSIGARLAIPQKP